MAGRDVERRPLMERCAGKFHLFPTATLRRITSVSIPSKLPLEVTLRIDRDGLLSRTDWQGPQTHELKFATISAEADSVDDLRRTCAAVAAAVVLSGRSADDSPATATLRIHP
jgi:hypothetical protein